MIYSVGCEYGVRALTRLASIAEPGEYLLLRDILADIDVPKHFVGKIFQALVRADILTSAKGRGGGFALTRPSKEIRLREIVVAIDGARRFDRCVLGLAQCDSTQPCPMHDEWTKVRGRINQLFDDTSLADLVKSWEAKLAKGAKTKKKRRVAKKK